MARPQHAAAGGRGDVVGVGRRAAGAGCCTGRAAPQDRDPLYREFLEWRASRAKASTSR